MNKPNTLIALAVATLIAGSAARGEVSDLSPAVASKPNRLLKQPDIPKPRSRLAHAAPIRPKDEPDLATPNAGFASSTAFAAAPSANPMPNDTTLSPPVTLTYSGSSNALTVTDSGTGRGISSTITNTGSGSSALFGTTAGSGAGLTGYNSGTGGPAGKFQVTNPKSAQPTIVATAMGTGDAIDGYSFSSTTEGYAIFGEADNGTNLGVGVVGYGQDSGVLGVGNDSQQSGGSGIGVFGISYGDADSYGVYAQAGTNGAGLGAYATSGYGISSYSASNYALYATTTSANSAIYASNASTNLTDYAIYGTIASGNAVEGVATAENGYGVFGQSSQGAGVYGTDMSSGVGVYGTSSSGYGVYGTSSTGYAGYFNGKVTITGTLVVGTMTYTSDRNLKTGEMPVDSHDVLERLSRLPISSWTYKNDPDKRHVGPMAQDFHAAFGLNGSDETHISEVDIAGVSLAAIQELNNQMKAKDAQVAEQMKLKDAQIAELKAMLAAQSDAFSARIAALEQQRDARPQTASLR